jgi:hypothetical protein
MRWEQKMSEDISPERLVRNGMDIWDSLKDVDVTRRFLCEKAVESTVGFTLSTVIQFLIDGCHYDAAIAVHEAAGRDQDDFPDIDFKDA